MRCSARAAPTRRPGYPRRAAGGAVVPSLSGTTSRSGPGACVARRLRARRPAAARAALVSPDVAARVRSALRDLPAARGSRPAVPGRSEFAAVRDLDGRHAVSARCRTGAGGELIVARRAAPLARVRSVSGRRHPPAWSIFHLGSSTLPCRRTQSVCACCSSPRPDTRRSPPPQGTSLLRNQRPRCGDAGRGSTRRPVLPIAWRKRLRPRAGGWYGCDAGRGGGGEAGAGVETRADRRAIRSDAAGAVDRSHRRDRGTARRPGPARRHAASRAPGSGRRMLRTNLSTRPLYNEGRFAARSLASRRSCCFDAVQRRSGSPADDQPRKLGAQARQPSSRQRCCASGGGHSHSHRSERAGSRCESGREAKWDIDPGRSPGRVCSATWKARFPRRMRITSITPRRRIECCDRSAGAKRGDLDQFVEVSNRPALSTTSAGHDVAMGTTDRGGDSKRPTSRRCERRGVARRRLRMQVEQRRKEGETVKAACRRSFAGSCRAPARSCRSASCS